MGKNNNAMIMEQRCKKHPSHKQSRGVCPSCLREKLSHLSTSSSSSSTLNNHSNSSSTNYSSLLSPYSSDSNPSSVVSASPFHKKSSSMSSMSFSCILVGDHFSSNKPLKKSRSLAFVVEEKKESKKKKNKRGRFWSKLMMGRMRREGEMKKDSKINGGMLHSKTVKERLSAKWAFFS